MHGATIPLPFAPPIWGLTSAAPEDTQCFQYGCRNRNGPCAASVDACNAVEVTRGLQEQALSRAAP